MAGALAARPWRRLRGRARPSARTRAVERGVGPVGGLNPALMVRYGDLLRRVDRAASSCGERMPPRRDLDWSPAALLDEGGAWPDTAVEGEKDRGRPQCRPRSHTFVEMRKVRRARGVGIGRDVRVLGISSGTAPLSLSVEKATSGSPEAWEIVAAVREELAIPDVRTGCRRRGLYPKGFQAIAPSGVTSSSLRAAEPSGATVYSVPSWTNAIREPSGDHAGHWLTPSSVICRRSDPSALITKICEGPQKASCEPSGDQTRLPPPPGRRATSSRRPVPSGLTKERTVAW